MKTISNTTVMWAQEALQRAVDDLLDDPYGVVDPGESAEGVRKYVRTLRVVADEIGTDLDALLAKGTLYEIDRLDSILCGGGDG